MNVAPELVVFAAVQVLALALAYVKLTAKLSHIDGQMIHFNRQIDKVDDLAREVDLLDHAQIKTAMDVDSAFEKLRGLQNELDSADTEA